MAGEPPGQLYLAPYVACALGEYFMNKGGHVLVVFDDFTKHAWAYREISLILGRPPGRESYPGDVFYLHSRMIERAARLTKEKGNGSMTFLPIVELLEGDLTGYISSNLVSMTDGQIYLSSQLFGEGTKPAIGVGLSVSRIGSKVQWPAIKRLSKTLRLDYVQYQELLKISQLKSAGQSEEAAAQMRTGKILSEFLKQEKDAPVSLEAQTLLFMAYQKKLVGDLEGDELTKFRDGAFDFAVKKNPELFKRLREKRDYDEAMEKEIVELINEFIRLLIGQRPKEEENEDEVVLEDVELKAPSKQP
jgi:F-type H+-transporting ATPase subunit alpha